MNGLRGFTNCRFGIWKLFLFFTVIMMPYSINAVTKTINGDGTGDYQSLNAVFSDLESVSFDTLLFTGTKKQTYTVTQYAGKSLMDTLVFKGEATNPDSFPVIVQNQTDRWYNLFSDLSVRFENLTITGNYGFRKNNNTNPGSFIFKN